jgi:hypothetical protein
METKTSQAARNRYWVAFAFFSLFTFHFSLSTSFAQEGAKRPKMLLDGVAAYVNE